MLITRVNKSLHWVSIDLAVDVEHNHLSEAFRGLLHRNGHILLHVMLPEMLLKKKKGREGHTHNKLAIFAIVRECVRVCMYYVYYLLRNMRLI